MDDDSKDGHTTNERINIPPAQYEFEQIAGSSSMPKMRVRHTGGVKLDVKKFREKIDEINKANVKKAGDRSP